jgi:hypothetical protein
MMIVAMDESNKVNRIDEIASDLDDLQRTADEIADEPPAGVDPDTVQDLKKALAEATAAADDLEDQAK